MNAREVKPVLEVFDRCEVVRFRPITTGMSKDEVWHHISRVEREWNKVVYISAVGDFPLAVEALALQFHEPSSQRGQSLSRS